MRSRANQAPVATFCACRLYPPSACYAAKVLVNLPFSLLNILTLALIVYGMIGLSTASAHAEWGSPMLEHMVIASLGYLVAAQVGGTAGQAVVTL